MKKRGLLLTVLVLMLCSAAFANSYRVPKIGFGFKVAKFGVPNFILDKFLYEHPEIKGNTYAFEIRTYGSKGPKSTFSGLFSFEYSKMTGHGAWRQDSTDRRREGKGEIEQMQLCGTIIMSLFPRSPIHPFFGMGVGIAKSTINAEGVYRDEYGVEIRDTYTDNRYIPVAHIPIGIIVNFRNRVELRIEGGFKNGFYAGGSLILNL